MSLNRPGGLNRPVGGLKRPSGGLKRPAGLNRPSTALAGPAAPSWSPEVWFSARSVDALANTTMSDGQAVGTWKNLGSLGSAADAVQAVGGSKPAFKLVASAGLLNNNPSVSFDGSRFMSSASFTSMPQPNMTIMVVRWNATGTAVCDGSAGARHVIYSNPFWAIYAGAGPPASAIAVVANKYNQMNLAWNGASTALRVNKADVAIATPGTHGSDMVTLGANYDGSGGVVGEIVEFMLCGTPPASAAVEAWVDAAYGSTWSQ